MSRKTIVCILLAGILGALLGSLGITPGMWQTWAIMVLYVGNGINERTK